MARPRHATFIEAYGHIYGGAQRIVHLLAEHLPERGFTTDVVLTREGPVSERISASGVEVNVIPTPPALDHYGRSTTGARIPAAIAALPTYWRRLARHLRARPGVVHGCSQRSVILGAPAARLARARFVWQVSVLEEERVISLFCDALAHRTAGLSASVRVPSLRPWRDQDVVFPPLDPRLDEPLPPERDGVSLVVTAGRLEPMKEFELLIRAMVKVRQRVDGARLQILGSRQEGHDAYADELLALRDRLGLTDAVEFTGFVPRPEDYWRRATLHVQPSHAEGNSLAVMEAMASGIPVVVTSTTGNADVVEHGRSGLIVPPKNEAALADAISTLLVDPARTAELGAEARRVARELYSVDSVVARLVDLYERTAPR